MSHPLDRPVWNALSTEQAHLAVVTGAAVRIDPAYGPFAAARDAGEEAQAALVATLRGPDDRIGVVERAAWPAPPGTRVLGGGDLVQMVLEGPASDGPDDPRIELLRETDADEMAALAHATEPGPWGSATHRYGAYYGIRIGGRLASMAGERLRLPGLAELSGVSTWPEFRGQGLAAALVRRVVRGFVARGDTPFLHCYAANAGAVALYEKLGFRIRAEMTFTILALA
ncbi:MAG TPA: GNAT family N-acetyltransferase [Methylomirabilota bacterium]|nr:GNAT family N-acetyltransferase [Methylomirabilota bacterium]